MLCNDVNYHFMSISDWMKIYFLIEIPSKIKFAEYKIIRYRNYISPNKIRPLHRRLFFAVNRTLKLVDLKTTDFVTIFFTEFTNK